MQNDVVVVVIMQRVMKFVAVVMGETVEVGELGGQSFLTETRARGEGGGHGGGGGRGGGGRKPPEIGGELRRRRRW